MSATLSHVEAQFGAAMLAYGLNPLEVIADGILRRFDADDDKKGRKSAWYVLYGGDVPAGAFGNWKIGVSEKWCAKTERALTPMERKAFQNRIEEAKQHAELTRLQLEADAAKTCAEILANARDATDDNPYCIRKGIKPYGLKEFKDKRTLIVPIRDEASTVTSLQFIYEDGTKRFKSHGRVQGCYYSFGGRPVDTVLLCEGFATGASLHAATGYPVAVAFNAGNLEAVARALHAKLPRIHIIVCADNDRFNSIENVGVQRATSAAIAVGGYLAIPEFSSDEGKLTDFNDLHQSQGLNDVSRAIESAKPVTHSISSIKSFNHAEPWAQPQALISKFEAESYPIDVLPDAIRAAVGEVAEFVKAPIVMVASAALAALSLVSQAHVDVKRAEKLSGPVGLFLLTIADSGERKSTCDGFFTRAIKAYEEAQIEAAKPLLKDHRAAAEVWDAKRGGIKEKIRQLAKNNKPTKADESALRDLEHDEPESPRVPRLIYADATPEALAYSLAKQWPSGGVVSAEAGIVFGSHGMGKDSVMRNLSTLNQLWDGNSLTIDRKSSESFTVRGARLTVALQVQLPTLREFFSKSGALARGTGFLARFLVAWPESTQGARPFTEAPAHWPHLDEFDRRITAILDQAVPIDEDGSLAPTMLSFTTDAKAAWVEFYNAIEAELGMHGELYEVRDVASKSADNAARLAAIFHMFEGKGDAISRDTFDGASTVIAWHLSEARRFFGEIDLPAEQTDAVRLDTWLLEYCRRLNTNKVSMSVIQKSGPGGLRDKAMIESALVKLTELDRARIVDGAGKARIVEVNPLLVGSAVAVPAVVGINDAPANGITAKTAAANDMVGSSE